MTTQPPFWLEFVIAIVKGLLATGVVGAIVALAWLEDFEGPVLA